MPYLSSTLFFVAVAAGLFASIVGALLLVLGLWPGFAARSEAAFTTRPVRSVVFGLPTLILALVASGFLLNVPSPPARLAGALVLSITAGLTLAGLVGVALRVGRGLGGADGQASHVTMRRGATALLLAWLFPLLGWFVVLPLSLGAGLGVAFEGLLFGASRQRAFAPTPDATRAHEIRA